MAGGALKLGQMRRVGVEIGMDEGGVSLPSCIKIGANEEGGGVLPLPGVEIGMNEESGGVPPWCHHTEVVVAKCVEIRVNEEGGGVPHLLTRWCCHTEVMVAKNNCPASCISSKGGDGG